MRGKQAEAEDRGPNHTTASTYKLHIHHTGFLQMLSEIDTTILETVVESVVSRELQEVVCL